MGQAQSIPGDESQIVRTPEEPATEASPSPPPTSMEALVAEATSQINGENKSLDMIAQEALECPCMVKMKNSPCWPQIEVAFICYIKSNVEEKGSDCLTSFVALQDCIKANPNAFSEDASESDDEDDKQVEAYKFIPPSWSRETKLKN